MSIAHFLMITEDAAYMSQDQDSAGCFLLEEYMKTALLIIFYRLKNAGITKTKVKIDKWIGIKDFEKYEKFVNDWHYFLKDMDKIISKDESMKKNAVIVVLKIFYWELPAEKDFYEEFYARLDKINNIINGDDSI